MMSESRALYNQVGRAWFERRMGEKTQAEMAEELGWSRRTVEKALRYHGLATRPMYEEIGEERLRMMYLEQRMAPKEIAAELGYSVPGVVYALRKFGLAGKQKAVYQTLDAGCLRRLYVDEGLGMREVAEVVGVSAATVAAALRYRGIPIRQKGDTGARKDGLWHDREWLAARQAEGATQVAMAREAGCSPLTISRALERLEVGPTSCTLKCRWWGECLDWPVDARCRAAPCRVAGG